MLQRVIVDGISFPRLYIAENNFDVRLARENGIPYVKWQWGKEELVRQLLRPTLEKMFPGIDWNKVLGKRKPVRSQVVMVSGGKCDNDLAKPFADYDAETMLEKQHEYDGLVDDLDHETQQPNDDGEYVRTVDVADGVREFNNGDDDDGYDSFTIDRMSVRQYVGDLSSSVDIEALQKLGLLPKFVGDIADCIRRNLSQSMRWTEGYNKKLVYPLGRFNCKSELPSLLIIDISASIPDGIAATMLMLADTLRSQCNAELIITSHRSGYYPIGTELPKPQTLRDYYGRGNESIEFRQILAKHIAGREFGYVISFGDDDTPCLYDAQGEFDIDMKGTVVHSVLHYHTWRTCSSTGYAKWVDQCSPNCEHAYDKTWCNVINKGYRM